MLNYFASKPGAALILVLGLLIAIFTAAITTAVHYGAIDCAALKAVQDINVDQLIKDAKQSTSDLTVASSKFAEVLKKTEGYPELVAERDRLREETERLRKESSDNAAKIETLEKRITSLNAPEPQSVKMNQSVFISGIIIGVAPYREDEIWLTVNGDQGFARAGTLRNVSTAVGHCKIRLHEIHGDHAVVSCQCSK